MGNDLRRHKVVICGAGIGGLTVAHELAKHNFEVVVYERNGIVGGLARSTYDTDPRTGYVYPVEYSWRIYGTAYKNLLRLMQEIPLRGRGTATVRNNLIKIWSYIFPRFDKTEVIVAGGPKRGNFAEDFARGDIFKLLDKIFYCVTMSQARMNSLEGMTWKEFCTDLSPEANKYMVRMWGPVLGMDATFVSFPVVARMAKKLLVGFLPITGSMYVMNKPTNDAWFDEWVVDLQNKGVTIQPNVEVLDFGIDSGAIRSVTIRDSKTNVVSEIPADYVVCAMSVESVAKLVQQNPMLAAVPSLAKTPVLAAKGRQIQLSVLFFLNQKLIYPLPQKLVLYLPDTPWALIIEPEDLIWEKTYSTNDNVKTVLSVGICQTDAPGILHQKPFVECTEKEIEEEVWAQMVRSYATSSIKTETGGALSDAGIERFYLWDSYRFDHEKKRIEVWEPKFSNNAGSLPYQPSVTTELANLFFATAYTKTERYIYSMEAAAEAGVRAANEIKQHSRRGSFSKVYPFEHAPLLFLPLLGLDALLYRWGMPHLSRFFGNSVTLVMTYVVLIIALVVWFVRAI